MTPFMIEERARHKDSSRAQAALHNDIVAPVVERWYGDGVTWKDVPTFCSEEEEEDLKRKGLEPFTLDFPRWQRKYRILVGTERCWCAAEDLERLELQAQYAHYYSSQ